MKRWVAYQISLYMRASGPCYGWPTWPILCCSEFCNRALIFDSKWLARRSGPFALGYNGYNLSSCKNGSTPRLFGMVLPKSISVQFGLHECPDSCVSGQQKVADHEHVNSNRCDLAVMKVYGQAVGISVRGRVAPIRSFPKLHRKTALQTHENEGTASAVLGFPKWGVISIGRRNTR